MNSPMTFFLKFSHNNRIKNRISCRLSLYHLFRRVGCHVPYSPLAKDISNENVWYLSQASISLVLSSLHVLAISSPYNIPYSLKVKVKWIYIRLTLNYRTVQGRKLILVEDNTSLNTSKNGVENQYFQLTFSLAKSTFVYH